MILALVLSVFAQTPATRPAPRIENPAELRAFNHVQKALLADPDLLGQYRGLSAYLAADPELRQAEESHQALLELPGLRARVDDFEEVLRADTPARADFDRFFARLRRDPALRDAIEGLATAEAAADRGRPDLSTGLGQLRAHPDTASPILRPLRAALRCAAISISKVDCATHGCGSTRSPVHAKRCIPGGPAPTPNPVRYRARGTRSTPN